MGQTLKHLGLTAYAAGRSLFRSDSPPLRSVRCFLVLQYPAALGAAIHATPLIPALRAAVPNAQIVVCASGFALEVLRHNPGVDLLVETPNPTRSLISAASAIRRALPSEPFATLTTTAEQRTTIALAASLAGATSLAGFTLAPELYRAPILYDRSISQIANNLRIVHALGHDWTGHFEPQCFFSADDLGAARSLVSRFSHPNRPIAVLVTQTSPTQRKQWATDRFEAAARHLIDQYGMNILLVGTRAERPAVEELTERIGPRAINVAGETGLTQLAALLSICQVGLTLDTGILHVGRSVGLPMVVVAPAWSPPVEWLPLDDPRYIILKNADLQVCPPGYLIDEVSVDEVVASLDKLLQRETTI